MTKQQKAHKNKKAPNKGHLKVYLTPSDSYMPPGYNGRSALFSSGPVSSQKEVRLPLSQDIKFLRGEPSPVFCAPTGPALTGSCRRRVSLERIRAVRLLETKDTLSLTPPGDTPHGSSVEKRHHHHFLKEGDSLC